MNPSNHKIEAKSNFIGTIAKCLYDAVGDDIQEDIKSHGLVTQNSKPTRIWDLINTNIYKNFLKKDIIANPTKRGAWEMMPIFERATGTVYTLMREQRFASLIKERPRRRNAHYVDALAKSLNGKLRAPQRQRSLFSLSMSKKIFDNEKYIQEIVQKIMHDLGIPNELVGNHALILFRSFNDELSSLRCCIVDSNLDIVEQADWSHYIKAGESVIVDQVIDKTSAYVDPTAGLQYRQKATDKLGQKRLAEGKNADKVSNDIK